MPKAKFDQDASYLLVGGTGGIGGSIAHWMVDRGARNLILMSRTAGSQGKTSPLAAELEDSGCRVFEVGCDVSDATALARALRLCKEELPPIRGVVQGAMVLKVCWH